MNDESLTLVMGARSGIGRLVLRELKRHGRRLRASARDPKAPLIDGVEAVAADLTDPQSLRTAFAGVQQVFLFSVPRGAEAIRDVAAESGVEKLVLLSSGSVLVPSSAGNPITVEHRSVEHALTTVDGPQLVPIRPLVLATNSLSWAYEIKATGRVSLYRPDALNAPVHEADVAAVSARALLASSPDESVSRLLTGPHQLSQRDQVAAVARAIGRSITVIEQTRDDYVDRLSRFMPRAEADAIAMFFDDCAAGNSPATDTARRVLGREPVDFAAWALEHADDFR